MAASPELRETELTVLKCMTGKTSMTREKIMETTGIPWSTVYDALVDLQIKGMVEKQTMKGFGAPGRKKVYWSRIMNE